jgi:flagellar basal body P-ring protein FlgI
MKDTSVILHKVTAKILIDGKAGGIVMNNNN